MKLCSWCGNSFHPTVSYQIYCSVDCRTLATKEKIIERHRVLRIQKRKGKVRFCSNKCGNTLSMYNDETLCSTCEVNMRLVDKKMKEVRLLMHDYEDDRG